MNNKSKQTFTNYPFVRTVKHSNTFFRKNYPQKAKRRLLNNLLEDYFAILAEHEAKSKIAGGHALLTSAVFVIFGTFFWNSFSNEGFFGCPRHCASPENAFNYLRACYRTYENDVVFTIEPRGGHAKLGKLRRLRYLSGRKRCYPNGICSFNLATYKILRSGDVETNPGYETANSDRNSNRNNNSMAATNRASKLSVLYSNARSIVNKIAKLQLELAKSQVDDIVLTETHLDASITDADVFGSDYSVYRRDRLGNVGRHGGGVLIATTKRIVTSLRGDLHCQSELLFVDITTENNKKLTIGVFYRPPNSNLKPLQDLQTCLTNITTTDLLVIGDFNLREFDWSTNQPTKTSEHHTQYNSV